MATASQIISRALRLIGVQDPRQALDAEEAQNALDTLNVIGQRWLASGLLAAWTDVTSLTGSVTPGASQTDALSYALALRVAPEYGVEPSAAIVQQYDAEMQSLWRDRLVAGSVSGRTAGDLTLSALRLVSGAGTQRLPDAVSLPGALASMNAIGQRWLASGLVAAWTNVSAIGSAVSTTASQDEALVHALAVRLCGEYGVAVPDALRAQADKGVAYLWRDRLTSTGANTAENIILRALRLLSGNHPQVLPDTVSFPGALDVLNCMLAEWHEAEIGLPDYTIATLATALASDSADAGAISYQLAIRLAPEYGVSLPPELYAGAESSMSRLRLRYFQPGDSDYSELPGESIAYNIETDR